MKLINMLTKRYLEANPDDGDPGMNLDDPGGEPDGGEPQGNWRTEMAGDDTEAQKLLERYTTPGDFLKAHTELRTKLSERPQNEPFPADGDEDAQNQWRAENGVPEADAYFSNLPDEVQLSEADLTALDGLGDVLRAHNAPAELGAAIAQWQQEAGQAEEAAYAEMDKQELMEFEKEMRGEWGPDYLSNMNVIAAFIDTNLPADVAEQLKNARTADGKALLNIPAFARMLATAGRLQNPLSSLPPSYGDSIESVEGRIKEIENVMHTNRAEYDRDEKMQAELRDLYGIREKFKQQKQDS